MSIIAARIDNRLLHGIVATQWVPQYNPQRLMVIDDEYANDPTKKAAMRMAKPAGAALSIISEETALANFKAGKYDTHSVFIVTKSPRTLVHVMETGRSIPCVIVGGTVEPKGDESAKQVSRRAYVFDEDVDDYRALAQGGSVITVQYTPADKADPLSALIDL